MPPVGPDKTQPAIHPSSAAPAASSSLSAVAALVEKHPKATWIFAIVGVLLAVGLGAGAVDQLHKRRRRLERQAQMARELEQKQQRQAGTAAQVSDHEIKEPIQEDRHHQVYPASEPDGASPESVGHGHGAPLSAVLEEDEAEAVGQAGDFHTVSGSAYASQELLAPAQHSKLSQDSLSRRSSARKS